MTVGALADEPIPFNEHIRPILANNCFACHGVDAAHRKAKLRLDTAEGATAEKNGLRAITPGDLEKSEIWHRIISKDEEEVMPPPESHKPPLKPEEIALIKRSIQKGAEYQNHWAYEPVAKPKVPSAAGGAKAHPTPDGPRGGTVPGIAVSRSPGTPDGIDPIRPRVYGCIGD